jgi:hypothetical protein
MKNSQEGSRVDLNRQKKELVNLNTGQLKLPSLRKNNNKTKFKK